MASAGDGDIVEAAAEATPARRNRRTIYDYLGEGDDGDDASASAPPSPETPPRLRLPRFTCARIRFGRPGRKKKRGGQNEAAAADKSEDASVDSSGAPPCARAVVSGGGDGGGGAAAGQQTGMGLSMLFLLARTCVELNRMAEVRAQMETLLNEVRDEAISRVKGGAAAAAADHVVLVTTPKACSNNLQSSSSTVDTTATASSSSCVSDTSTTECQDIRRGEHDGEELPSEAEAVTEPPAARRRHDTPDQCSVQSSSSSDDGEFIELVGGRLGTGGGGNSHSQRGRGAAAVVDESDDERRRRRRDEGGVSATELERRLHELQHRRDRERIEALESALRRARRKLTEKEMEARLWQDTATLALGHPMPWDRDPDGQ